MDVVEKRGNLVMDKDKAIFIAAELIAELKSRLHRKKTTKQEQIIKSKISKIRKTRTKLNALTNTIEVKKCIGIIFDYFDKYFSIGSEKRKKVLSKIRKRDERLKNKELKHKECIINVSRKNKDRINKRIVKENYQTENDVINKLFERSKKLARLEAEYNFS